VVSLYFLHTDYNRSLMSGRFPPDTTRSKDAPMDYQWTNRSPVKPAWAAPGDEPNKRRKRNWACFLGEHTYNCLSLRFA